jgi:hypothetical protein
VISFYGFATAHIRYFGRNKAIPIIIIITTTKKATEIELAKLTVQPAQAILLGGSMRLSSLL